MKPIVDKVLGSGLVDKHMVVLMERWGYLPEGSNQKVPEDDFKYKTREQLVQFAEEIGDEVMKEHTLRETSLDLDRLRWPTEVSIYSKDNIGFAYKLQGLIDNMGRLYFRIQDVKVEWFVPGYSVVRTTVSLDNGFETTSREVIVESGVLYSGETPVCLQVSVMKADDARG